MTSLGYFCVPAVAVGRFDMNFIYASACVVYGMFVVLLSVLSIVYFHRDDMSRMPRTAVGRRAIDPMRNLCTSVLGQCVRWVACGFLCFYCTSELIARPTCSSYDYCVLLLLHFIAFGSGNYP